MQGDSKDKAGEGHGPNQSFCRKQEGWEANRNLQAVGKGNEQRSCLELSRSVSSPSGNPPGAPEKADSDLDPLRKGADGAAPPVLSGVQYRWEKKAAGLNLDSIINAACILDASTAGIAL